MRKFQGGRAFIPAGIAIGTGVSALLSLVGAAIIAWLVNGESLSTEHTGVAAMLVNFLSGAAGAWTSILLIKKRKLLVSLATGGCYLALLLSVTAMFFGGQFEGAWKGILAVLVGSLAASLLGGGGGFRSTKRLTKKVYR